MHSSKKELALRDIQLVSVGIMEKIDRVCSQEGFRYYLYGGSLIGAIRHKGFIPWDDDIDIVMPRNDYERFLKYFEEHKDELYPLKLMNNRNNKNYPYMISRVSNDEYYLEVDNEDPYGMGIFIDVYPWDGGGDTETQVRKLKKKASRYSSLCYLSTRKKCTKDNTKSKLKLLVKPVAFVFAKIMGKDFFQKKLEQIASSYDYEKSSYVGCVVWGCDGDRGFFLKEWMGEKPVRVNFEKHDFCVPKEYDKCLKKLYGDYMKLPPAKDRVAHHYYKAYRKDNNE